MDAALKVNEIYRTIQGEGARAGRACALVRLTGCNLRCAWCDTQYAYDEGREMSADEVLEAVRALGCKCVLVTGGEPLLQEATPRLLSRLCDAGYEVLLKTNGSLDVSAADPRVIRCVDVKCPGSGQADSFLPSNLERLRPGDEVNFVLADRGDYQFARGVLESCDLSSRCTVFLTPAGGLLDAADLARWVLEDPDLTGHVRVGLQLHKLIWPGARRGV